MAKYYTPSGRCIQLLDYSKRLEDGRVESMPDSLKKEFKTTNGRSVFDGGGIDPDIAVEESMHSLLLDTLQAKGLIFDYATIYALKHPQIEQPRSFKISEETYNHFTNWVETQSFDYTDPLLSKIETLELMAKEYEAWDSLEPGFKSVFQELEALKTKLLQKQQLAIRAKLEAQICMRYYNERGATESQFKYDNSLKKAIEMLNSDEYERILK